jgi:hypothetical protein
MTLLSDKRSKRTGQFLLLFICLFSPYPSYPFDHLSLKSLLLPILPEGSSGEMSRFRLSFMRPHFCGIHIAVSRNAGYTLPEIRQVLSRYPRRHVIFAQQPGYALEASEYIRSKGGI